ncbi:uncharacterized protein LOC113851974 [Abrus precatorius]|uniref:Uncharacterized protein LOC113851974 n=1 Tax=Abrus precatorius TaxID=3816 RepID=A0A8B8K2N5_ABRPR|nr:uncharacterized protein LOC113851974 [Abrus precatorius]
MAKRNLQFQQNVNASIQDPQTQIGQLATTVNQFKSQGSGQLPSQPKKPPLPFPNRVAKPRPPIDFDKELFETFRRVEVNILLLNAIKQILKYAKFLKEICTNKRRLKGDEKGYWSLSLNPLKQTGVVFQLANKSTAFPTEVVEDVLVRVDKLIFPVDLYILDMVEESNMRTLILGRPFLKTIRTKIDVHSGILSMEFGDDVMQFNVFEAMKHPLELHSAFYIDIIDVLTKEFCTDFSDIFSCTCTLRDLCKVCAEIYAYLTADYVSCGAIACLESSSLLTGSTHTLEPAQMHVAELDFSTRTLSFIMQPPTLKLKPQPKHLKYAFFKANNKLLVIILADLDASQEVKLLQTLAAHKQAIG